MYTKAKRLIILRSRIEDRLPYSPLLNRATPKWLLKTAYVGAVGAAEGVTEIAVLGSAANLCARLSSKAAAGEILISGDGVKSGNLDVGGLESRMLELKGVSQPVSVYVMKVS